MGFSSFALDLRHAARVLRKSPGFTITAIAALAVGIGATTAIFSLVDAALLRPLPFPDANRLVMISERPPNTTYRNTVSGSTYRDWRDQSHSFESMAAQTYTNRTLTGGVRPERIRGQQVTASYFSLLGVQPFLGRIFTDAQDHEPLVLISHSFWTRKLAADRNALGRSLILDGTPHTIIGVLPPGFQLIGECDLWTPLALDRDAPNRRRHSLRVAGRLKPSIPIDQARAEMIVIAKGIAEADPDNRGWGADVDPMQEYLVGSDLRETSLALMGAVGFLLLLSCVNVANLLLVRAEGRTREMAMRTALGASRLRMISHWLAESLLLAAGGGAAGLWLAALLLDAAPSFLPSGLVPPAIALRLDARVVAFTVAASILTAILFSLAPVFRSGRALSETLRAGGRTATRGSRTHQILASAEIALAIILVTGAGLLVRSLLQLEHTDRGYDSSNVLTMHYYLSPSRYKSPAEASRFTEAAVRELENLPGVLSAGTTTDLPLDGWSDGELFQVAGHPTPVGQWPVAHFQSASPRYFETLGIHFLQGRGFTDRDNSTGEPVCVINERLAGQYFAGENPVGTVLGIAGADRRIVGVIKQVKVRNPADSQAAEVYVPDTQASPGAGAIAIRTTSDPLQMIKSAQATIARIDKDLPLTQIRTMEEVASQAVARPRLRAVLAGVFASAALALATLGVYGVLAYTVSQRWREFGIRMALGANTFDVLALVLGQVSRIAIFGIAVGLGGAALLARSLTAFLFEVRPIDPLTFAVVPAILVIVAIMAAAIPARRATGVDPAIALHQE